jgi:hypothetical protein
MRVFRSDPTQRGFSQPCPLWQGECTIYASPHYPHVCRAYRCKLLKEMLGGDTTLHQALGTVEQAKGRIHDLETLLPVSSKPNFRERLVTQLEASDTSPEFRLKAGALLDFYEKVFGVTDVIDKAEDELL